MELVKPELGLIIWMLLSFAIVVFLLKKFAWKPILESLHQREDGITSALRAAEEARAEMARLQADNNKIMEEAKRERDIIIKEARDMKDRILSESREQAHEEARKIMEHARAAIISEKNAAVTQMKDAIAELSVSIAQKILTQELANKPAADAIIKQDLQNAKLN